jgi:hypothetical protein
MGATVKEISAGSASSAGRRSWSPATSRWTAGICPIEKAEMILRMLLEGNSVSSVSRLTDVHIATILEVLVKAGEKAEKIMAKRIRNIEVRDVECDELWLHRQKAKAG